VETPPETPGLLEAVAGVAEQISPERKPQQSAITQAIAEISQIIEALKRVLDQMEEVLELAELAERQKTADEQEIESLRRALRQLQRPADRSGRRHGEEEARG
jgi:methyl-accepting chemotaxis protein